MKRISIFYKFFLIMVLLTACSPDSPDIQITETDNKQEIIPDIVHINNCGGTANTEQTATRSFSTSIEGSITAKLDLKVVAEGGISAKYGETKNTSKSITLVAPPGTNMEFTLQWTEQTWIGRVIAKGESGDYVARMPISVDQIDAKNLGCNSTSTPVPNWAITFEYNFPANYWSIGMHEYTLTTSCPNIDIGEDGTHGGIQSRTFEVSESAQVLSGDVYLRLGGLRDGKLEGNPIDKINPSQTTIAILNLIEMTQSEAEIASTDCTITISWDGKTPEQLTPGIPYQR